MCNSFPTFCISAAISAPDFIAVRHWRRRHMALSRVSVSHSRHRSLTLTCKPIKGALSRPFFDAAPDSNKLDDANRSSPRYMSTSLLPAHVGTQSSHLSARPAQAPRSLSAKGHIYAHLSVKCIHSSRIGFPPRLYVPHSCSRSCTG